MDKYLMIQIDILYYFIKYRCNNVTVDEIEDAFTSYLDSPAAEDSDDEEMIADVMNSFPDMEYEILNYDSIEL